MGIPNFTPTQVSVTNQGVQTSGANSGVLSADKNTQRSTSDIPHKDDIAFLSSSFTLNSNISSNIAQGSTTPTYPTLTFTTTGKNWKGDIINPSNLTRDFFNSTRFDQPTDSGSMFIYDQIQDYSGADTLTGTTESFAGENYRVQINDNLLSASYADVDHFNTSSYNVYNLGTGKGTSVLDLVKTFEKINNIKIPYKIISRRIGDLPAVYCDNNLAFQQLNWTTKNTLVDVCKDSWHFITKNEIINELRGINGDRKLVETQKKLDKNGNVIESKFTQRGSTTIDRTLITVAEEAAKKYQFTSSEQVKQCGTITINFKLK